ncbi:MAG: sodium:proton antiporter [Beijerinckiaceae bacterium]|nr:sodium:proton antiporter [Beijerinckiaceae bacterium]
MKKIIQLAALCCALPGPALAAEGLDGASLSLVWAAPFVAMLLSIAIGPLLAPSFWHHHYGKVTALWAALTIVPLLLVMGPATTAQTLFHTAAAEYIPFILMLLALFTAAGGLVLRGNLHGSPVLNVGLLAIGTLMASVIGTTGAAMVFIRPLLRANDNRRHNVHVVIFFIFLVANIGGSLTPIGDPPLFLGFLRGVEFTWTLSHLWPETLFAAAILLALFFALDLYLYRREGVVRPDPTPDTPLRVTGLVNLLLIGCAIAAIVLSGAWKPGIGFEILGTRIELQNLVREATMVVVALASLALTKSSERLHNGFEWGPIVEVAKLFAGIFITIVPVMAMLNAGSSGAFAPLVALVTGADGAPNPVAYFWLTGLLSSFLDNAPTYLVFFELAGGDAQRLMGPLSSTLSAISLGAVYMGANTYIGNAPNFMVYAIARTNGVAMPSFFGYMLWSTGILVPLFILVTLLFLV